MLFSLHTALFRSTDSLRSPLTLRADSRISSDFIERPASPSVHVWVDACQKRWSCNKRWRSESQPTIRRLRRSVLSVAPRDKGAEAAAKLSGRPAGIRFDIAASLSGGRVAGYDACRASKGNLRYPFIERNWDLMNMQFWFIRLKSI